MHEQFGHIYVLGIVIDNMFGSTLTACDAWATLNVLKLQKICPLRDLNLRPLEQN
jgi:hypothetical protein